MVWMLLGFAFVAALGFTLRSVLGRKGTALLVAVGAVCAGIAFSTERLTLRTSEIDSRFELLSLLVYAGLLASIVLTLRALIERSWWAMWLAALATLPLILSQLAVLSLAVTCLQLGAAVAMRRGGAANDWLVGLLGGVLFWAVVIADFLVKDDLVPPQLVIPLLVIALLLPLAPWHLTRGVRLPTTHQT